VIFSSLAKRWEIATLSISFLVIYEKEWLSLGQSWGFSSLDIFGFGWSNMFFSKRGKDFLGEFLLQQDFWLQHSMDLLGS